MKVIFVKAQEDFEQKMGVTPPFFSRKCSQVFHIAEAQNPLIDIT